MSARIKLAIEGVRATITLDRPDKHNALEIDDLAPFAALVDAVAVRDDLRVLVLTGAGEKSFCSGIDLGDVTGFERQRQAGGDPLDAVGRRLWDLKLPTLCAFNGGAYGGAVELGLACDFRFGVEGMRLFVPPARLGVHYNLGGMRRYLATLGLPATRRLLLAAEEFDGPGLLALGLIDRLIPRAGFAAEVDAMAERLAGMAPLAIQGMKRSLNRMALGNVDEAAAEAAVSACFLSQDLQEGLAAMKAKRRPLFQGR